MAFSVPIFVLVVNGIVTSFSGIYMEMCLGYMVFEKYHILWVFYPKSQLTSKCLIPLLALKTFCSGQNILQFFHENSRMNSKFEKVSKPQI